MIGASTPASLTEDELPAACSSAEFYCGSAL